MLTAALDTAAAWIERPALASAIDAIAVFSLEADQEQFIILREEVRCWRPPCSVRLTPSGCLRRGQPGRRPGAAARSVRDAGFDAAYENAGALGRDEAIAAAQSAVAW